MKFKILNAMSENPYDFSSINGSSVSIFLSELAQSVVDAGAVPLLVLCIQEPELSLKRIAASALSDICKHSPELAQTVVDAGAIAHLAQMILNPDAKLKVSIFTLSVYYESCSLSLIITLLKSLLECVFTCRS